MLQPTKKTTTIILIALILFMALFVFFTYTFFHELGHTLVGLLLGQSLTEVDLSFWDLSAHVGMTGGVLTPAQLAVRSAAGTALPLVIWMLFMSFVSRRANLILEILKLLSSMAVINTLLTWIAFPILFLFGKAPSDDVINFLQYSHITPLLLTLIAIVLYISGWLLFLSKLDGLRDRINQFTTTEMNSLLSGTRTTFLAMISLLVFCVITTLLFNSLAIKNSVNRFSPPPDFALAAELDLSKQGYASETLTQFVLDKPAMVNIFISVHNINTTYFDCRVTGTNGYSSNVLHGEGYRAAQDSGLWQKNLPAGTYRVVLNSHQSPGMVSVYFKIY